MPYTYYDIGLNLFTKSFPHPEKIIGDPVYPDRLGGGGE